MKNLMFIIFGTLFCYSAQASITTAKIDRIMVSDGENMIYVYPVGGTNGALGCDKGGAEYYSFSSTRSMANQYLSVLLAAQASGKLVDMWGKGDCIDIGTSETLDYIRINNQ